MCHVTLLNTGLLASNSLSFSDDVSHSRLLNFFVQGSEKQQVFQMGFAAHRKGDAVLVSARAELIISVAVTVMCFGSGRRML